MYVVTLNAAGGSLVEAAQPVAAWGFPNEEDAELAMETLHTLIGAHPDEIVREEYFPVIIKVYEPTPSFVAAVRAAMEQEGE